MSRRIALDIKKKILGLLKQRERSIRELETKVNTNHNTMISQLKELEYFGLISFTTHEKNEKNGRPYTTVKLKKKA